ncbi:MAG: glycosyltransferase family 4 protein [Methylacidiphilales bacterium]|nr:glycosyltransferase family 4 protein [Candidatus Methylacidiphilales bacterium]
MRILLLSRWYWEEARRSTTPEGGPVRQLAEAVAALGHEVVVLSQSPTVSALEKNQIGLLETWLFPRDKKRSFLTGLRDKWAKQTYRHRKVYTDALALRDFLGCRGPFDLLWAQSEEPDGLTAAIAAQLGVALPPLIVQIYALRYDFQNRAPVFGQKPGLRLAFRHANRIVANSRLVADSLSAYAGSGLSVETLSAKTHVIGPNLQHEFLRVAEDASVLPATEPSRVLFLGALNEKKGALVFLEALAQTEAARNGVTFALIGDFTERNPDFLRRWNDLLEKTRHLIPGAQLELLGKVPSSEVIQQIGRAAVIVLPSLYDEFSRALVECLVLGRPVVTTHTVGAWPIVREHDCGLVVEPGDSAALARAIDSSLASAGSYAANARRLSHRLIHEYSPDAIARQFVRHFSEIVR